MAPSDTRSGADAPTTPAQALGVATALFERLHADGIAYCLWKSNEHLSAAMTGATDLDVLVDRDAALRMGGLLSELGYKRVTATPRHAYAGIEDYLALDRPTGRLAHLHLHYQLTLGEKNVKGYRLPWEDLVLDSRVLNREYGVFTTEPTLELVLLVVRSALRLRTRDMVSGNREAPAFRDAGRREFEWLVAQTDQARVRELTERLLGPAAAAALAAMLHRPPTIGSLYAFRRLILPAFADFRIYGRLRALRYRWSRELALRWEKARRRLLGFPRPYKHTLPRGGLIVVFVGCDGSGKSTVTREITRWLSWKLDVAQLYFGSGNGPASLIRWPLRLAKLVRRRRERPGDADRIPVVRERLPAELRRRPGPRGLRLLTDVYWALALARERRQRLSRARRARNLGMIVVCDRYPQGQVAGQNDGPRLRQWARHASPVLRSLSDREILPYRSANVCPPDLVIKLHVRPDVAAQRRPSAAIEALARREEIIASLAFPHATRVVDVDANRPLEEVVLRVKEEIWRSI